MYHSTKIGKRLCLGTQEKKNTLLLLILNYDNQFAIATGSSTEKTSTDSLANILLKTTLTPRFKQHQYYEGVNKTHDYIFKYW